MMRVSICSCVSTAIEMLKLSTDSISFNAGTIDFDYFVVTWNPSKEVKEYIERRPKIIEIPYEEDPAVGYVPNLRGMINTGLDKGFERNEYAGLVNTDMYFGGLWLLNLMKYAEENVIVNSTHITRINGSHVITADLCVPTYDTFNFGKFEEMYAELYNETVETEEERGGWMATNTMPYLIHRKWWEKCGPWELEAVNGQTPDRRFFQRCHDAGARFAMSRSSIVYHHEAVERSWGQEAHGG